MRGTKLAAEAGLKEALMPFDFKVDVVDVTGKHDATNVKQHVDTLVEAWELGVEGVPIFVTHDQGTNITKAITGDPKFASVPCMAHMLHNSVGHGISSCTAIKDIFNKICKITTNLNKSP